jgi:hypothetical protein
MRHERWRLPATRFAKLRGWFGYKYFLRNLATTRRRGAPGRARNFHFFQPAQTLHADIRTGET